MSRQSSGKFAWLAAVCTLSLAAGTPAAAQALIDCGDSTDYSTQLSADVMAVVIDANTGERITPRSFFAMDDQVALLFVHKNPMRYDYRFIVDRRLVEGDTIVDSLKLLSINVGEPKKDTETPPAAPAPRIDPEAAAAIAQCSIPAYVALGRSATNAETERKSAAEAYEGAIAALSEKAKRTEELRRRVFNSVPSTQDSALQLCKTSAEAYSTATAIARFPAHSRFVTLLEKQDEKLAEAIREAKKIPSTDACNVELQKAEKVAQAFSIDIKNIKTEDEKLATAKKELAPFIESLDFVFSSPSSFIERRGLGPTDAPTEYDISIVRTDRLVKEKDGDEKKGETTVKVVDAIQLGRSRFSFSGGIGASLSDQRTFERHSAVTTVNGTTTVTEVVGVKDESDARMGIVGQLNGQIWQASWGSVGWSLGASITDGEDETDFGFYTGPNVALIRDNLFLTLAYHLHKQDRLGGGFAVGDVIPAEFTGPLPTTKETQCSILFSVTYRIR